MEERILEILKTLVAMKSVSCSTVEVATLPSGSQPSLKRFLTLKSTLRIRGFMRFPGDRYNGRKIPYAFLKGKKKDAVLLSGHFDVVSTEEYGKAEPWAYEAGTSKLEEMLRKMPLDDVAKADLESGEWIWGRGVADMKGGLAIHAALFEQYAKQALDGTLEGSIMFMPVPDEESYSAGMRNGVQILKQFKEKYGLNYKLLIDPGTDGR